MITEKFKHQFKINEPTLDFLDPILQEAFTINCELREQIGTNLNWFNERANISVLAGALWRKNGFVVEEYSAPKGESGNLGRIDIFFKLGNKSVICEVKHRWIHLIQSKHNKDYVLDMNKDLAKKGDNALFDIEHTMKSNNDKSDIGLAITYFVPYWKNDKPTHQINALKKQLKTFDCSFYSFIECTGFKPLVKLENEQYSSLLMVGQLFHR